MAKTMWENCLLYIKIYSCTADKLEPAEDLRGILNFFKLSEKLRNPNHCNKW